MQDSAQNISSSGIQPPQFLVTNACDHVPPQACIYYNTTAIVLRLQCILLDMGSGLLESASFAYIYSLIKQIVVYRLMQVVSAVSN